MINTEHGTPLAERQDKVWKKLQQEEPIANKDYKILRSNIWVKTSKKLAPSNLVIRHLILLDIINEDYDNYKDIRQQLEILSPDVWVEGYSYWRYTRPLLQAYADNFYFPSIKRKVASIENNFMKTAYMCNGALYPAPFGDLRKEPLDHVTIESASVKCVSNCTLLFMKKRDHLYYIKPHLLGFNTHVPNESMRIDIYNGIPQGFKWYTGHENKYNSKKAERRDTFNAKRFLSLFNRRW